MADSISDPFDWSVDQVVHEFCRNPKPAWSSNNNPPRVTNTAALEQALRENDINGEPLLVLVNQQILKDDLGIKSLGERYHIMRAIESLRNLSSKYHLHQREQAASFHRSGPGVGGGFMSPQITQSNFSAYPFSPYPTHNGELRSRHVSPSKQSMPELPPLFSTPRVHPQVLVQTNEAQSEATQRNEEIMQQQPMLRFDMHTEQQNETAPSTLISTIQAGVQNASDTVQELRGLGMVDEQVPKDRTLTENQNRWAIGGVEVMEPSEQTKYSKYSFVGGRKRLAPTFVSHISKTAVLPPDDSGAIRDRRYHLGTNGLGPENVFYPDSYTSEDEIEQFTLTQHESSKGQSLVVARLIKYYYQQPIRHLPNSKARAKIPYSGTTLNPGDPQYFTMFVPGLEPAQHDLSHWPGFAAQSQTKRRARLSNISMTTPATAEPFEEVEEKQDHADDYDYLLEKYPPLAENEDVLALYGDSGDEGEYDLETWNEIEQDRREAEFKKNSGAMSRAEVETAIEEAISQIIDEWRQRKLVRTQLKGHGLWIRANSNEKRQAEMNNASYWVHRYDQTIKRMRETITKDIWFKAAEVKQQCKIFDEAIAQREEYQYFVEILGALEAPARPDVELVRKRDRVPRADVPDGEEVLESDSELGDFVVNDDSSDVGSIPHDAAAFADAMEFLGPEKPPDVSQEIIQAPQEVEITPPPAAHADVAEPTIEEHQDLNTSLTHESEVEYFQGPADVGDISEDDIISPARKAEISRRGLETPTKATKRKIDALLTADEADESAESANNSDLDALPTIPMSRYRPFGRTILSPVDLTFSSSPSAATSIIQSQRESSSDYQVQTPELNPIPTTPATKKKLKLTLKASSTPHTTPSPGQQTLTLKLGFPSLDDIPGIKGLDWEQFEESPDRRRALAKVVYNLNSTEARKIQAHVKKLADAGPNDQRGSTHKHVSEGKFLDQIRNALVAISSQTKEIEGVPSKQKNVQNVVRQLALLFASYANHTDLTDEERITGPLLQHAFEDLHSLIKSFFDCLLLVLRYFCNATDSKPQGRKRNASEGDDDYKGSRKGDADSLLHDADEDSEASAEVQVPAVPSPIKKRKRKVLQSQEALSQQRSDQLRVQEEERRKALADIRLANMGVSGADPAGHIVGFGDPQIFLDEHIGKRVKPHQVNGIQFMWREIITDPKQQGCLLAHTMGLGKTMQVISLLVTIALSARSTDLRIRNQVPEHLRKTKTLILCPPSLIDNWQDELIMWRPNHEVLGKLYKAQSGQTLLVRLSQISEWAKKGGVFILSYELFRGFISNDGKKMSEEQHAQLKEDLLESPTIVVADEAHKMKNAGAKITQLASRFNTTSRIALTGSPLANNLEEYHTMIDWIAPGYLGTMVQFKDKYSEPISWGLYEDSMPSDKRLSLRKLITLGRDLEPKLNRADISAIEKEMPSKTEFFITIPLTQLQTKAYNVYAQALLKGSGASNPSNTKLWQWLHVLGLLCNHPSPFVNKLDDRRYAREQKAKPREKQKMAATDESQGEALPTDVVLSDLGLSADEIEKALIPFRKLDDENKLEDPVLSNRSFIVSQIVEESLEIGDKVLIFSHTIPTLNYLEKMLDDVEGCITCRIDGETKMSTRQEATKVFNKKDSAFNVFLISMKAGGLGLNLQGANRVIIYDFGFNPTWEDQAIGRAYRLGQKKSVYVYRFRAGGTFEDVTYNKAVFKTTLFSRVVDKKNYMSQAKKSLSSYVFSVKDVEQHGLEESLGKDRDVLDRIVQRTKCIRNIELTETFQKEDLEKLSEEEVQLAVEEYEDQRMKRDDPAGYARKQATNVARQMQSLSTYPGVRPPAPATPRLQSTTRILFTPTHTPNVISGVQQAETIPGSGGSSFNPQQLALFGHRAPTSWNAPHPFHQELISDATPIQYTPQQPPRASSTGPEQIPQVDGTGEEPEPQKEDAERKDRESLDERCRTQ